MYWKTNVYHASKFNGGNTHILPKTSHLWILSRKSCKWSDLSFSLFKYQDQMHTHSRFLGEQAIPKSLLNNDFVENNLNLVRHKLFSSKSYAKSSLNSIMYNSHFRHPIISSITLNLLEKGRQNRFIMSFPFLSIEDPDKQLTYSFDISIEIPVNDYWNPSLFKKEDLLNMKESNSVNQNTKSRHIDFVFIPKEVHLLSELFFIIVRSNSIIETNATITFNIRS
ncbi:hypothetical protein HN51_066236 [Arachis hypogaea]